MQAFVVLGTALSGAQAAFVLTNGRPREAGQLEAEGPKLHPGGEQRAPHGAVAAASGATAAAETPHKLVQQQQQPQQHLQDTGAAAQQQLVSTADTINSAAAAAAAAKSPSKAGLAAAATRLFDVMSLRLWNPLTGHCVPVRDASCELRQVRAVGGLMGGQLSSLRVMNYKSMVSPP
jgi:hypothetical protein